MGKENLRYHTFPVSILSKLFSDTQWTAEAILLYPVMFHAHNILEMGSIDERIKGAAEYYNFQSINTARAKVVWTKVNAMKGASQTSISIVMAWDFYKNNEGWSTDDLVRFAAYCAMKSIIGKRNYANVKLSMLLSRMCGADKNLIPENDSTTNFKTQDERLKYYQQFIPIPEIRNVVTRRKIENIKHALRDFHLVIYANHTRGWSVSNKLDLCDLILKTEISKEKNKRDQRKQDELDAVTKVRAELSLRNIIPDQRSESFNGSKRVNKTASIRHLGKEKT
jgi:hypothetical protein